MIRAATMSDLPRLYDLLLEMQSKSKYAGVVDVDEATAKSLLLNMVRKHGGTNNGSSCFFVIEAFGKIEGFIIGMLDRVYHIGNRLMANDIYLYCTKNAPKMGWSKLIDAYVSWALSNPKVHEIKGSWQDALGSNGEIMDKAMQRKGFRRCGMIWERAGQ
jgi:hypothetical protein